MALSQPCGELVPTVFKSQMDLRSQLLVSTSFEGLLCPVLHVQNQSSFSPGSQKLSISPASERGTQIMQPPGPAFPHWAMGSRDQTPETNSGNEGTQFAKRPAQLSSNVILIHGAVAGGGGGSSRFIWMTSGGTPSLSKHSWIRGVCSDVPAFVSHVSRLGLLSLVRSWSG